MLFTLCLSLTAMIAEPNPTQEWAPKQAPIMTRWAKDVSPDNVHPEYPRPQMVRKEWMNLNGLWDLQIKNLPGSRMGRPDFLTKILVPFPVESALSGVMMPVDPGRNLEYRRTFKLPANWKGKRVVLHFGAVDWETTVSVNGKEVGNHVGGYDSFSFDITPQLKDGDNELVVLVHDPTDSSTIPRGKQVLKPEGIWYTPTSGIWQTVWLEPVPDIGIQRIEVDSDLSKGTLRLKVATGTRAVVAVNVIDRGTKVASQSAGIEDSRSGGDGLYYSDITVRVDQPKAWTPESPFLYDLEISCYSIAGGSQSGVNVKMEDLVRSYTAFRTISIGKDDKGRTKIFLNGKPYFLVGPLDQGFWPDGLYTAPSDAALKYDLEITKKLGFNFIRKHVKVEPERWYYHCDKMGLLVFQDMPSGDKYIGGNDPDITRTSDSATQFKIELAALIQGKKNHPCIVGWVPYNEGWGQWDTESITEFVRAMDPTRLVDNPSGWTDRGVGDVHDIHAYPGPASPKPEANRAAFLGEFGGLGLPMPGHMWQKTGWGYRSFKTQQELTDGIVGLFQNLRFLVDDPGLSGAVYTQTTDVEQEVNGLMTYDRALIKPDAARLTKAVKALFLPPPTVRPIIPTSETTPQVWSYRTTKPEKTGFEKPDYDDSSWQKADGGFGTRGTPGAVIQTIWNSPDIWLRRKILIPKILIKNPHLRIHHDEDVEVYIDGKLLLKRAGYTTGYVLIPIPKEAAKLLTPGKHTLAVHCKQTAGGQFIDVGIVDVE